MFQGSGGCLVGLGLGPRARLILIGIGGERFGML